MNKTSLISRCSFVSLCAAAASVAVSLAAAQPATADTPLLPTPAAGQVVTVDCVGDSITAGVGSSSQQNNWPSLLADLLGTGYSVNNFGESGATLLKNGDSPYWKRGSFAKSAGSSPNVVVILLGTNDSKPWNWKLSDEFAGDYAAFIDYFAQMPTHPLVFVCTPPPVPGSGNYGINDPNVQAEIPMIQQVAAQKNDPVIDVHTEMPDDSKYFADNVHPNDSGYVLLASAIYTGLTHTPAILPIANRTFTGTDTITMATTDTGVLIHYTLDGSTPTRKSPFYTTPLTISSATTVKAQEFNGPKPVGLVTTAAYTPST